jgi:hypothetical protein
MELGCSSEILVSFCKVTENYNPDVRHWHHHRHEKIRSRARLKFWAEFERLLSCHSLIHTSVRSFIHPLTKTFKTHSLIQSQSHAWTHIHALTFTFSPAEPLSHSFTQPHTLSYALTHSRVQRNALFNVEWGYVLTSSQKQGRVALFAEIQAPVIIDCPSVYH